MKAVFAKSIPIGFPVCRRGKKKMGEIKLHEWEIWMKTDLKWDEGKIGFVNLKTGAVRSFKEEDVFYLE